MNTIDKIDRKLNIGANCFHMNISFLYELYDKLYLSFAYTHFDFIYNKERLTGFINPKPAIEYISEDNDLIISGDIDSSYLVDYDEYIKQSTDSIFKINVQNICSNDNVNLEFIKENYLNKGNCMLISFDHYYLYEEFAKVSNNLYKFHTKDHIAVLIDIDFVNNTALIVDKFYSFVGNVNLDNFKQAIHSSYLENPNFYFVTALDETLKNNEDKFKEYFSINLQRMLKKTYVINNVSYAKNVKALEQFINDFDEIIDTLILLKGKFAPQFFSKLLSVTILQKNSYNKLLNYYSDRLNQKYREELLYLCGESSKMWALIDAYNDKTYLSNKTLIECKEKYKKLLNDLYANENKLFKLLSSADLFD